MSVVDLLLDYSLISSFLFLFFFSLFWIYQSTLVKPHVVNCGNIIILANVYLNKSDTH